MNALTKSASVAGALIFTLILSGPGLLFGKKKSGEGQETVLNEQITEIRATGANEIYIQGTKKLKVAIFVVPDPIRMMINLQGFVPAPDLPRTILVDMGLIKNIQVSELSSGEVVVTRLEVALNEDAEYKIEGSGKEVFVKMEPKAEEKDQTIPEELYSRMQKATTELIETGELSGEIQPHVTVPRSAPGAIPVTVSGTPSAELTPEMKAMKGEVSYPGTATRINGVKYRFQENLFQLLFITDGSLGTFKDFPLIKPNRIVIDLMGLKGPLPWNSKKVGQDGVRRIRLGKHPDRTRIVIDCSTPKVPQYYIMRTKAGIMVAIAMGQE
jgi:hypothetical protein